METQTIRTIEIDTRVEVLEHQSIGEFPNPFDDKSPSWKVQQSQILLNRRIIGHLMEILIRGFREVKVEQMVFYPSKENMLQDIPLLLNADGLKINEVLRIYKRDIIAHSEENSK